MECEVSPNECSKKLSWLGAARNTKWRKNGRVFLRNAFTLKHQASNPPTSPHTLKEASVISLAKVPQCPLLPFLLRVPPLALSGLELIYYVLRWQIKNEINKYLKQMHF